MKGQEKAAYEKKIEILEKQLAAFAEQLAQKDGEICYLKEEIANLKRMTFASRSERRTIRSYDENSKQLNLFNEAEIAADSPPQEEVTTTQVKSHTRKKKADKSQKIDYSRAEIEKRIVDLPDDAKKCDVCGTELTYIGEKYVRREIHHIPAKILVVEVYQKTYKCPTCSAEDNARLIEAPVPKAFIPHSPVTPSLMTSVILNKYQFALPLERQSKLFEVAGNVKIPKANLANWILYAFEQYCGNIVDLMREHLLKEDVLHADETPVQVMREPGRKNTSKSYMWVFTTGQYADKQIRIFHYTPSRAGDVARQFLGDFDGFLHTDAFTGYNQLETKLTRCLCWTHARRNFVDSVPNAIKNPGDTIADQVLDCIGKLFALEKEIAELSSQERKKRRENEALPRIEALFEYLENIQAQVPGRSHIAKAINYILNNKEGLANYIHNGDCNISNNTAEQSIRPFAVGRKNWLFSGSPRGAKASAAMYSIIGTCLANGIDTRDYFMYLFTGLSQVENRKDNDLLEKYLPWNMPNDWKYEGQD